MKIEKEKELGKGLSIDEELELMTTEIKKVTIPQLNNNEKPYQSKIIGEAELVPYIEDGWEIVRELSSKRFLMKRPNHVSV